MAYFSRLRWHDCLSPQMIVTLYFTETTSYGFWKINLFCETLSKNEKHSLSQLEIESFACILSSSTFRAKRNPIAPG